MRSAPTAAAKDLGEISALDFSKSVERDAGAFCRQGYGALLAKLAEGIPVELETPVTQVDTLSRGSRVDADDSEGNALRPLHDRHRVDQRAGVGPHQVRQAACPSASSTRSTSSSSAASTTSRSSCPAIRSGLQRDDLVFEKSSGPRTAALLANVSGTSLSLIEVGGRFGRELAAQGDKAMVDFAVEWLAGLFGAGFKRAVQRTQTTQWNAEPWTLGAFSAASPGGQWARRALMEPIRDRVFFAGEAVHETMWGTVGGAWESGERAADAVVRRLSGLPEPPAPKPEPAPPPQQRRTAASKAKAEPKPNRRRNAKSEKRR